MLLVPVCIYILLLKYCILYTHTQKQTNIEEYICLGKPTNMFEVQQERNCSLEGCGNLQCRLNTSKDVIEVSQSTQSFFFLIGLESSQHEHVTAATSTLSVKMPSKILHFPGLCLPKMSSGVPIT